jgi:gamma-butyrobetaine dioxygenase
VSEYTSNVFFSQTDNNTNENTDQLGYTNVGIASHTDMPFMAEPPSCQMLQGIKPAERGGEVCVLVLC